MVQKFCSARDRHRAYFARRAAAKAGNGEDPEPIRDWERPMRAPNDGSDHMTAERLGMLAPPALPWEQR
jgi:hypothetical protein